MSATLILYRVDADASPSDSVTAVVGDPLTLGQSWDLLQTVLAGDQSGWTGRTDAELAIVGGRTTPTTAGGMLISIDDVQVRRAAAHLAQSSFSELVTRHRRALESACGGDVEQIVNEDLLPRFEELRSFYRAAAEARNAVVKRLSG
ncbi:DUF1877 family protein [Nonomuraea sp. NPDC049784]|uniref:DUF1877 family protein n=1 Tax=Nonomuraea sp. NPDC049784 TaxID=3154361 RepID=UPI0033DE48A5